MHRNHFGRQIESFVADVPLPFLAQSDVLSPADAAAPFPGVFIRAPIVEQLLVAQAQAEQDEATVAAGVVVGVGEGNEDDDNDEKTKVEILGVLPDRTKKVKGGPLETTSEVKGGELNDIVAVRQGNIMGTSFHPELTDDVRIHVWWLEQVLKTVIGAEP